MRLYYLKFLTISLLTAFKATELSHLLLSSSGKIFIFLISYVNSLYKLSVIQKISVTLSLANIAN